MLRLVQKRIGVENAMRLRDCERLLTKCCLAFALLFVFVPVAVGQPTSTATPTARRAGRPFPPAQYIPPHDYDQRNIKLDLRFDWEQEQAIATATITLAPTLKDFLRVNYDAAFMSISAEA